MSLHFEKKTLIFPNDYGLTAMVPMGFYKKCYPVVTPSGWKCRINDDDLQLEDKQVQDVHNLVGFNNQDMSELVSFKTTAVLCKHLQRSSLHNMY